MRSKSSILKTFTLKGLLILACVILGAASVTTCNAQSIVGKWKRTGTKIFVADKATGKQTPVSADVQKQYDDATAERGYNEILELKPDNTYHLTVSTTGEDKPIIHDGNYALTGNELDMNIPLVKNEKTTITIQSINGTTMVWDLVFMGKLTEIIYTRTE